MRVAQMRKRDISNGAGIRCTLFVSGCTHNCPNCFNKEYQSFSYGEKWTKEKEDKFMSYVLDQYTTGINILGGEPLQQLDGDLLGLLKKIKQKVPQKPIWLWTGYVYEDIKDKPKIKEILDHVDVLIDGRYVEGLKDLTLQYRGSSNQRVIYLK